MKKLTPERYMMLYGVVVGITGLIGYMTAGSFISLLMGVVFGSLAALSGYGLQTNDPRARPLGFLVSAVLGIFFMIRVIQGSSFPALGVAGLSLIAIAMLMQAGVKPEKDPENSP